MTALLVALALAWSLLAACGGSGDEDLGAGDADRLLDRVPADQPDGDGPGVTEPGRVDACGLLTDAEVGQATGGEVDDRSPGTSTTGDPSCTWRLARSEADPYSTVVVTVYEEGEITFEADRGDPSSEVVGGLGQGAYWQATVSVLNVLAGARNLTVQVVDGGGRLPAPAKEVAIQLARTALARL